MQARSAPMVNWFPFAIPGDLFYSNLNNRFEWISSVIWPLGGLDLFLALCFVWQLPSSREGSRVVTLQTAVGTWSIPSI